MELLRELGARREERVRPRRRAEALARRREGRPAGAAGAVPDPGGFDVSAVGQRRRRVALREVVGRGAGLLIGQVGRGDEARVLAADAAGLGRRHGLEDRGDACLALVGGAIRRVRLARGLVAREAVEGEGARRARQQRVSAGLAVAALHARDRDRALGAADGRGDGAAGLERVRAPLDERLAARVEAVRAELRSQTRLFGGGVLGGGAERRDGLGAGAALLAAPQAPRAGRLACSLGHLDQVLWAVISARSRRSSDR
mmetsp:Transcript_14782/g.39177  ORF Transcript_14782/g.39177 Transcript_14782/m.39177 type:complete len:258 (+) Transcript_14782:183-956(+)